MNMWPTKSLGEICRDGGGFIRTGPFGSQLHRSDYTEDPQGIPVVMPKDMARGRINTASIARIDVQTADRLRQHLLSANDVVLSRRGDVGRTAWVFAEDLPAFCGTGSMRVHPGDSETVRPAFLRFFFHTKLASDYLESHAVGATMPNLNAGIVERLPVPVPPLQIQDSVIGVLEAFDNLIETCRRRVDVLEKMARAIYREWFVKFRYPGHTAVSKVDSTLGLIPKGWQVVPVSTAIRVNPRIKLDKVEHPFIAMGDLDERSMGCRPSQVRSGGSGAKFERGDTLMARITPCLQNGKTGLVQSLADGEVGLGSTEFIVLRGQLVGSAFTYCLAREDAFRGHAIASMSGASGRQRVRNECFETYLLAVPPQKLADTFETTVDPLFSQAAVLLDEAVRLEALRDVLLPKLMMGRIDVSTLNLDALLVEQVA